MYCIMNGCPPVHSKIALRVGWLIGIAPGSVMRLTLSSEENTSRNFGSNTPNRDEVLSLAISHSSTDPLSTRAKLLETPGVL